MSTLYGARPVPSGSQSTRGSSSSSSSGPPPRFEFGSTSINRPEQFVSMTLRTQPRAYPHQTATNAAAAAAAATMPRPTPPLSARPASAASSNHTPRGQAGRPHTAAVRPELEDDAVRDRYLPSRPRPYTARAPEMLSLPHSYAHVPGGGIFPHEESEYLAAQGPGPDAPLILALPSEHSIAYAAGQLQPAPHIPATNQSALFTHVDPRARIGNPSVRDFMSTPTYFAFQAQREAREKAEEEERARAAAAGLKGSSSRRQQRQSKDAATAAAAQPFAPSIPYPARFASASGAAAASASSSSAAAASIPASSALRIPTVLGLHERTLDSLQVLRSLKAQLDSCFELVRLDETERRHREAKAAQEALRGGGTKHDAASRPVTPAIVAASPAPPMQFIQAGHVSIPNTPNVTSQTIALLMHTPVLSAKRNTIAAAPPEDASSSQQQPTFLTDEVIESHALSNLSVAQRRTLFGGSVRVNPAAAATATGAAAAAEEKEKEAPFDRDDLTTHPDQPKGSGRSGKPRKLGASTREAATTELPAQIVYTPEMCAEFEESVRHWGAFLLASASTAAAASSAPGSTMAPSTAVNPNEDLILVLNDACAKYCSLVRLAMAPQPQHPSSESAPNQSSSNAPHHLLPRLMEHVWKLVMLVLEVALVRKAERLGRTELTTAEALLKPETREAEAQTGPELFSDDMMRAAKTTTAGESENEADTDDEGPQQPAEKQLRLLPGSSASASPPATLSSLPTAFDPARPSHLAALESSMSSYESSMVLRAPATATALTAADEVLDALAVQHREAELKESGLYSVGLMLQRDSLLKASERLMRENEFLKFRLRQSTEQVVELTERQDTALRALAEAGEDSVGIALDELDEWMEDALDARKAQMDSMARLGDLAWEYSNKHAASVSAEATADSSHKESMDTLRRLQGKESEIARARQAELDAQDAAALACATAKAKAFSVMDREIAALELLADDEIAAKVAAVSDVETLRGMVVKLLYTKVRRHLHETPAQRAVRLRKEGTPRLVRGVFTRVALSERIMPVKPLSRSILEIYMQKIVFDEGQARDIAAAGGVHNFPLKRGQTLHGFSYSWFLQRFGLRAMAESNLAEMLRSVLVFLHPERAGHRKYAQAVALHAAELMDRAVRPRLSMFARLMHLYTDAPLPSEALEFFLYLLKVTQEAAAASLPPSFNAGAGGGGGAGSARPARESQADTSKAMLRSLEAACVPIHVAGLSASARAVSKRNSLTDPALLAQAGLLARAVSPTRGSLTTALDGLSTSSTVAATAVEDLSSSGGGGGSIGLFVPLFLAVESTSHAFKQLGYSDDALDAALVQLEREFVYPLAPTKTAGGSAASGTESAKLRLLFKQILVRQMIRSASVGLSNPSAVWDRFDSDRAGSVGFDKFRAGVVAGTAAAAAAVDEETFALVRDMMDPAGRGFLGPQGALVPSDLALALSPDYRLALPLDAMLESATGSWLAEHRAVTERYRLAFMEADPTQHGLINFNEFWQLVQNLAKAGATAAAAATATAAASSSSASSSAASTASSAAPAAALPATALAKQCSRPVAQRMFREGLELERRALLAKAAADALKAEKEREREAARAKKGRKGGASGRDKSPARPLSAVAAATASAVSAAPSDPASPLSPGAADKRSVQFALPDGPDAATAAGASASSSSASAPLASSASSASPASRPLLGRQLSLGSNDFISLESCLTLLRRYRVGLAPRRAFAELRAFCRRYKSAGPLSPPPPLSRRLSSEASAARRSSARSSNGAEVLAMLKARVITTIKE